MTTTTKSSMTPAPDRRPAPRRLGYARVSTTEQDPALQRDALAAAGCERVWVDVASGASSHRPALAQVLEQLHPGDTLVVWRLDRLGRNLPHLVATVTDLEQRHIGLQSLTESIDTTSPAGRLVFYLFSALAEFERQLLVERTTAGLQAARARGRVGGRPLAMTAPKLVLAQQMRAAGHSLATIAAALDLGKSTVARHLAKDESDTPGR